MKKKSSHYKDLSKIELEYLKDFYIQKKVLSMSNDQLKDYVTENISLQIKSTIGAEEESEAWQEMEIFFKDEFKGIIKQIQDKFLDSKKSDQEFEEEIKKNVDLNRDKENEKIDMWED